MKLLLRKDIPKLGLCGDVVEVTAGYARNYLLPHHLGIPPTASNLKKIEGEKKVAAELRAKRRAELEATAARLADVEVTISSAANREGRLYGSVGPREVAAALRDEGHAIEAENVQLHDVIRTLDAVMVPIRFSDEVTAEVKVWVVREKGADDEFDDEDEDEEQGHDDEESKDADRGSESVVDALGDE